MVKDGHSPAIAGTRSMQFGMFGSAASERSPDPNVSARGYRTYVDTCVEAERLGLVATFLVEHHFTGVGQVSDTLGLLAWVAARTSTLRLGTAVIVLPWHHPVLLAERAATLDLMSGGRLDLGVGKGYRHNEFSGFCMPYEEAEPRFDEALDVMVRCWTSASPFTHRGRFWQLDNVVVEPGTAQQPHPPLWIAAGSAASVRKVARRGARLLLDQFASPGQIRERIGIYRSEIEAQGRPFQPTDVAVARNLFVAHDRAELEDALARRVREHQRMVRQSQHPDGSGRSHILAYAGEAGATEAHVLFGEASRIAEQLAELREAGAAYVLFSGGADTRQSLRRFTDEVRPRLRA